MPVAYFDMLTDSFHFRMEFKINLILPIAMRTWSYISWSSNAPCIVVMPSAKLKLFYGRREKAIEVVKCDLPSPPKACTK